MRRLLIPSLLVGAVLAIGGCGGDDDGSGEGDRGSETGGELFTQSSRSGTLTPMAGRNDTFKLTLAEPAPNVTVFTDRPARSASTEGLADFVSHWDARGFGQDPPNAALVIDQEPDDADTAVFTLAEPSYDQASGSVTYTATHISGGTSSLPSDEDIDPPPSFGDVHLFIDPSAAGELHNFELDLNGRQGRHVKLTFDPPWTVTFAGDQQEVSYEVGPDVGGGELLASEVDLTSSGSVTFGIGGGAGPITGTATIPSGAGVTVSIDDGPDQPLKNGNFSLGG
jgi:hypothetical protein